MRTITETIKHLLIINVIFFVASISLGDIVYDLFALHYPLSPKFQIWQPLTHMFMHGDIGHIFFNMFALVSFGSTLEQFWGGKKFLFFYFSCGIGAALLQSGVNYYEFHSLINQLTDMKISTSDLHTMLNANMSDGTSFRGDLLVEQISPLLEQYKFDSSSFSILFKAACENQSYMVGASGALYGILVAFAMLFPNVQLMLLFPPIPIKAKFFVPLLILFDLFFGFTSYSVGPIAHFAHIGGAVTGFLMMWYWKKMVSGSSGYQMCSTVGLRVGQCRTDSDTLWVKLRATLTPKTELDYQHNSSLKGSTKREVGSIR